jgi:hypothetical protein
VTKDEFVAALAERSSSALRTQLQRFVSFDAAIAEDAALHDGDLTMSGPFKAPAFCTLIVGDLTVDGVVDLENNENFDEGGLFVVLGTVTCNAFIGHYGKCAFIDGDLVAREAVLNGFEDSSLVVIGRLATRLFLGADIWAEVGAGAAMEYGVGYCLPLGYTDAAKQAIRPQHDAQATARIVVPPQLSVDDLYDVGPFAARLRNGRPIL